MYAFWLLIPAVHRAIRPTAWRKNMAVVVVVANTATRRRGMSTPSLIMRTATTHCSSLLANASITSLARGSSESTIRAVTP